MEGAGWFRVSFPSCAGEGGLSGNLAGFRMWGAAETLQCSLFKTSITYNLGSSYGGGLGHCMLILLP